MVHLRQMGKVTSEVRGWVCGESCDFLHEPVVVIVRAERESPEDIRKKLEWQEQVFARELPCY